MIDIDRPRGDPPPKWAWARGGFDVLSRLADDAGESWPPRTLVVATPAGGTHWYFRAPSQVELRNTQGTTGRRGLGWCVDTRGAGGYVLGAGSVGRGGRTYRVMSEYPLADLPGWLVTALTPPPAPSTAPVAQPPGALGAVPRRVAAYVQAVVEREAALVAAAQVGTRHTTLLAAARKLGHWVGGGVLAEEEASAALTLAAAHYVGVEGYTAAKVDRTIADGLAYGAWLPRGPEDLLDRPQPVHRRAANRTA